MSLDRSCSIQRPAVAVLLAGIAVALLAGPAAADVLYSYSEPFDATLGTCPDPVLEVDIVYDEAIPPNTPLPASPGDNTPGFLSWSFSACGETCNSEAPCWLPAGELSSLAIQFATDANGDPDEWQVALQYQSVAGAGESISLATTLRVGDGVQGDLYQNTETGVEGASLFVGSWTVTPIAGAVPVSGHWARLVLMIALLAAGSVALLQVRSRSAADYGGSSTRSH